MFVVVLTMGEKLFSHLLNIYENPSTTEICAMRKEETRRAVGILGLRGKGTLRFLDHEDGALEEQQDAVIEAIVPILRALHPNEVLCTSKYEAHPDHVAASRIAQRACERVGTGIEFRKYIISLKAGLTPETLPCAVETVDVARYLPCKRKAVAQFRAHLDILSPRQSRPIAADFNAYLGEREWLIR